MEMLTALLNPLIIFTIYHPELGSQKTTWSKLLDDLTADLALLSLLHDSVGIPALLPKTFFTQKCNHVKGILRLTMCKKQRKTPAGLLPFGHPRVCSLVPNSVRCLFNLTYAIK